MRFDALFTLAIVDYLWAIVFAGPNRTLALECPAYVISVTLLFVLVRDAGDRSWRQLAASVVMVLVIFGPPLLYVIVMR